jgi:hypothetical protein
MLKGEQPLGTYERLLRDTLVADLESGLLLIPKRPEGGRPKREAAENSVIEFIQEGLDRHEKLDAVYKAAEQRFELSNRQIRRIWAKRGQ